MSNSEGEKERRRDGNSRMSNRDGEKERRRYRNSRMRNSESEEERRRYQKPRVSYSDGGIERRYENPRTSNSKGGKETTSNVGNSSKGEKERRRDGNSRMSNRDGEKEWRRYRNSRMRNSESEEESRRYQKPRVSDSDGGIERRYENPRTSNSKGGKETTSNVGNSSKGEKERRRDGNSRMSNRDGEKEWRRYRNSKMRNSESEEESRRYQKPRVSDSDGGIERRYENPRTSNSKGGKETTSNVGNSSSGRIVSAIGRVKRKELLPGIPDDITVNLICTKVSWRDLRVLRSVSYGWRLAVQYDQIHESRVRAHSTETLAVFNFTPHEFGRDSKPGVALYSIRDQSWFNLPSLPSIVNRVVNNYENLLPWVSVDGKIYTLAERDGRIAASNAKDYVLDVVGRRRLEWRHCASMQVARRSFGVGVLHGKIYVFGGHRSGAPDDGCSSCDDGYTAPIYKCEVYDPRRDAWSRIAPLPESRDDPKVAIVGEEFWIYGGMPVGDDDTDWDSWSDVVKSPLKVLVYHPIKNDWRSIDLDKGPSWYAEVFIVDGKFHKLTEDRNIEVYDISEDSWSISHSFSDHPADEIISGSTCLVDGGEILFALDSCYGHCRFRHVRSNRGRRHIRTHFLHTKGFGCKKKEITLARVEYSSNHARMEGEIHVIPIQL